MKDGVEKRRHCCCSRTQRGSCVARRIKQLTVELNAFEVQQKSDNAIT